MGVPPVGLGKKSLRNAMPLLLKIGGIARLAIAFKFYANDSLARWDHPGNDISVGLFAVSVEQRMFGTGVLIQHEVIMALVLQGTIDQVVNLLRGKWGFGVFPVAIHLV